MNKAFYIIAIPAFIVSFCWLYYGWGLGIAAVVIIVELVAAIGGMVYLRRKGNQRRANEQRGTR
jgi:membrane protein implicated in regulation of membrane protease activity